MKKLFLSITMLVLTVVVNAQGIKFLDQSFDELLVKAKTENKAIFIDVYTSWCGPCKYLSANIFTLPEVGEYYNEKFLCLKLDAEKSEDGRRVAKQYGVTAYPTMLFINSDGEVVYKMIGGRDKEGFLADGINAFKSFSSFSDIGVLEAEYNSGVRTKEFLEKYYNVLDKAGLNSGQVLVDLFNYVPKNELLNETNFKRLEKATLFNKELTEKVISACEEMVAENKLERRQISERNRAVGKYLSSIMRSTIDDIDSQRFNEFLELRRRYFSIKGNVESVITGSMGGGAVYTKEDILRLDYHHKREEGKEFIAIFDNYMADLEIKVPIKVAEREEMYADLERKKANAEAKGNTEELKALEKSKSMIALFGGMEDYYYSGNLMRKIPQYDSYYQGKKDKKYKEKIAAWYVLLNQMSPACKSAIYSSEKLLELGKKNEAKVVLKEAIATGDRASDFEPADKEKCIEILNTIQ